MKSDLRAKVLPVLLLISLLLTGATPAFPQSHGGSESPPSLPDILILNSYHDGYSWSDNETAGIIDTFKKSWGKIELHIEYFDSKHFPNNEHFDQLQALFAVKYRTHRPTIIIILDNPAFEFAIKYRQKLFKGIPLVFAGLNDYTPVMLQGEKGITGIVEKQDFIGTVKLARDLQPGLKEVVMLHDATSSGVASRMEADEQFATFSSSVKLTYLPEMTINEVCNALKKLGKGTVVLPFSYSRDKAGQIFTHSQLAHILSTNSPVPVYSTKEERLGFGVIGGSQLSGRSHGAVAAELAIRILRGENPDTIPVITTPHSKFQFDYLQLKKFRINPDRLPAGSEIINKLPGFYEQHALVINVSAAIILLILASATVMLIATRKTIRAEEALVEAERSKARVLEAANKEMESFIYTISHDLQAPLRHITSYGDIILEEYRDRLDEQGARYLLRLKQACRRMAELINDILSLSRIGKVELHRMPLDLGTLAKDIFAGFQALDSSREITLTVDADLKVNADRKLITLALDHLIGNSWKYTAKIPHGMIHVGSMTDNGRVIFFVRDNGAGFDMQYAEKLFAPFQRLHPEVEFEGNGIGLATVQRIINRHGGQIWAESRKDEGATFFFTLEP